MSEDKLARDALTGCDLRGFRAVILVCSFDRRPRLDAVMGVLHDADDDEARPGFR